MKKVSKKPTTKSSAPKRTVKPQSRQAQPAQLLPIIERLAQSAERLAQAAEQMAEAARGSAIMRAQQQPEGREGAEGAGAGAVAIIIDEREGEE